ncbi:coxsackievirus and adenovirus receptor homolog isoform X2 [Scyliorhinus canicula]|uniref:coxsackievirus and adenovirus receptor homolog isoform X2 n=1 Tax=Scyliorhinus canicula TaxID=7830 RepID=UPI0018F44274|nr:coxsackievirus and adenovirus receptor homolog isoform X2 [Scyliorhinus canicula]
MTVKISSIQLITWLSTVTVFVSQAQQNKVNGSVGRSALLPCSFSFINGQYTNFSWLKNNSLFIRETAVNSSNSEVNVEDETNRNRIQLPGNPSSGNHSLLITHLRLEDFGMFRCEAYSKSQSVKSEETFLTVTRDGVSKPIVSVFQAQNITEQSSVVLKCEVASGSLPINYMWHRKASKAEKAKKRKHYEQTLVLNPKVEEDNGLFFCKVSNNFSTEKSNLVEIPLSGSATSSVETTLTSNNTNATRIPWLVITSTSAVVLFIVCIILTTIRMVKKWTKERQQSSSILLLRDQRDAAVQTNEEDLESRDFWKENNDVTYATIDHTRRLPRPAANARNTSIQFTESASMMHQP